MSHRSRNGIPRPGLPAMLLLGACLCAAAAHAETAPACDPSLPGQVRLEVTVSHFHDAKGHLVVTIYPDDAAHFLNGKYKVARQIVPIELPSTRVCFALPAAGDYAVALFQDANDNGHFDTNWLGLPTEGYGFSRDPKLRFGPPKLDQTRIPVKVGDNRVAVRMQYW
jgi:Uncharacterized protein conserved in bacteria